MTNESYNSSVGGYRYCTGRQEATPVRKSSTIRTRWRSVGFFVFGFALVWCSKFRGRSVDVLVFARKMKKVANRS